jgi:hypothetical protein
VRVRESEREREGVEREGVERERERKKERERTNVHLQRNNGKRSETGSQVSLQWLARTKERLHVV